MHALDRALPLKETRTCAWTLWAHRQCMLRSNCYKHGPSFCICTTASMPSASEDYVPIYLGRVSIYNESCLYICGVYMDACLYIHESCLLHIQQRVHQAQATAVLFIYTRVMSLRTIRSVSIYAYVSELAKCELESCAYIHGSSSCIPESCHMYMVYI